MTTDRQVLQCQGLSKHYMQGGERIDVLDNISLNVCAGERIAIVGASGSGKTTLLNMLGGLDDPTSGSVAVMGMDLAPMNESNRARCRNQYLGFVYQLLIGKVSIAQARSSAQELLSQVGLSHRYDHKPSELSGGERQRVAIARALVTQPACVLMDEPTGNLDPSTAETILNLLLQLNRELGISFVVVTHEQQVASQMDRVLSLEHGTLVDVTQASFAVSSIPLEEN